MNPQHKHKDKASLCNIKYPCTVSSTKRFSLAPTGLNLFICPALSPAAVTREDMSYMCCTSSICSRPSRDAAFIIIWFVLVHFTARRGWFISTQQTGQSLEAQQAGLSVWEGGRQVELQAWADTVHENKSTLQWKKNKKKSEHDLTSVHVSTLRPAACLLTHIQRKFPSVPTCSCEAVIHMRSFRRDNSWIIINDLRKKTIK